MTLKLQKYNSKNRMTDEKPEFRQMMNIFLDKVMDLGFTIKANDGVYGIHLDGTLVYSFERDTCKYNRHAYAKQITSEKLDKLELLLRGCFGQGGKGSSKIGGVK